MKVFREDADYLYFLEQIYRFKLELPFDLFHYCLMPNHTHMLIKTKNAKDFSTFMKKLNLAYFHYFRRKYGWVGHFWQDRFKSQPVGKDDYFIQCGKYIELNPVRKNLVDDPSKYLYSSFKHYATGDINRLITDDLFCEGLGMNKSERQKQYSKLVIDETILESYSKKSWGGQLQARNESQKINYHSTN